MPKLSVIIPVFNRQEPVKKAIQSVINQSYQDWECIVIDDASTDDTLSALKEISKTDNRIKVVCMEKNGGVSAARNAGLKKAKGEWILFLDSDDELADNTMAILSNTIEEKDVDMVVFATSQDWCPPKEICCKLLERDYIRSNILPEHINIHPQTALFLQPYICNKCIKRTFIEKNGIQFDEWRRTWEDNVFLVKCLNCCTRMYIIPDKLYLIGNYPEIDHLSRLVDSDLILNYIDSYYRYRNVFGNEFDYDNDYTARRYFGVIHQQLIMYFKRCDSIEFKELLSKLIIDEAMNSWVERIQSENEIEECIKRAFCNHDDRALFNIYAKIASADEQKGPLRIARRAASRLKRKFIDRLGK